MRARRLRARTACAGGRAAASSPDDRRRPLQAAQENDAALERHLERIAVDGYTDRRGRDRAASWSRTCATPSAGCERELDVQPRNTAAEGHATRRMYNLLAKDPLFAAMPAHPSVLPVVERLLDRGCLLSGMTAIDIGPGEEPQPLHGDDIVMSAHLAAAARADDGDLDVGADRLPAGERRHALRAGLAPLGRDAERPGAARHLGVRMLAMRAGSVMIFHGSLWHGGGANTTADEWRLGVNVQYCPGFVRQQQNPYLGIPRDVAARLPDRVLELLGYRLYKGIMGHVDGAQPGRGGVRRALRRDRLP